LQVAHVPGDPPPPCLRQAAGCSVQAAFEGGRRAGHDGIYCSGCGADGLKIKERRVKRWRHLDLGGVRCQVECRLRRLYCPGCGELPEMVQWARGGARCTRDFDDLTAWLAQQMSQSQVTRLMRIGWETVGKILARVVAEMLDPGRLDGLELIGVDEVSYGADHKFLTCVANHETGGIVWATEGRNAASL
jgi:transposase